MPSALETLVKILKLEREQGCNDTAVIGGLAAFSKNWVNDAHVQARRPEHHLLVDELSQKLQGYQTLNAVERLDAIQYMLDRIMGRVPAPPEFRLQATDQSPPAAKPDPQPVAMQSQLPTAPPPVKERPSARKGRQRQRGERTEEGQPSKQSGRPAKAPPAQREPEPVKAVEESEPREIFIRAELDIKPPPPLARPPRTLRGEVDVEAARDILRGLQQPVSKVKGVGERMTASFARLDVHTIADLLYFTPRRYDDYTQLKYISKLLPEQTATVIGTVRSAEMRVWQGGRKDFCVVLDDGSGLLDVVFFGQRHLSRYIKVGEQIVVSGVPSIFRSRLQLKNPEWEHIDSDNLHTVGIVPVYRLTEGLKAKGLRRLMRNTVNYWADHLVDYMPEATLERTELADLGWALRQVHFPESWDHLGHARARLTFDELLLLQLAVLGNRREWQSVPADALTVSDEYLDAFISAVFPYTLTGAQQRVIADIRQDLAQPTPMNRLLQGDVGSGKTAVAVTALAFAIANGKQAAVMAPTSILAEQHFRGVSDTLAKLQSDREIRVALLTGSLSNSERETVYAGLADGSVDVVIGTHALIQDGVSFHDLGIAIIDEQHRFGVEQRGALRGKGKNPHLLVMTATPIPRTLALTIHADLDLSVMDEMPPGRQPVQTRVIDPVARERAFHFVEAELEQGRQAFVVHPLVEQSDKIDARAALDAYEELSRVFYRFRVGLLHGRMRPAEKDAVMTAFGRHEFDVLVTTSVAEVGVDVPNASVIVIEGANRFGLAQLHQFRGRVGRGPHQSYCLLIPDNNTAEARERLQAMETISDGFRLAEMDWKLRGPGDLLGTRQSGGSLSSVTEFITPHLIELAQREARTIYEEDTTLSMPQHQLLAERVGLLQDARGDIS